MIPEIAKHLSQFAVRISAKKVVCGSGVIAYSNPIQNLQYVITARHCVVEDNSFKLDITVDFNNPASNSFYSIKPRKILTLSENREYDVAVLIIDTQTLSDIKNIYSTR